MSAASMMPKWMTIEIAQMTASRGSMRSARVPRTECGSIGRGCTGGSVTNWNSRVRSPIVTLPRAWSVSGMTQWSPRFWARPALTCSNV